MAKSSIDTIAVCGGGLAGHMCAVALAHSLPSDIRITLVETPNANDADIFYGNVTAPSLYGFLNNIGISEPELVLNSNTTFSFGTYYQAWGGTPKCWVQSFHLPFPPIDGIDFHHFITQRYKKGTASPDLEPYLISVQAAYEGRFAHPPTQQNIPLARAENGYHFSIRDWTDIFASHVNKGRVHKLCSRISNIQTHGNRMTSLTLDSGQSLTADLFIDCTGPEAKLISQVTAKANKGRRLGAIASEYENDAVSGVCRNITGTDFGWQAETPLQDATAKLTVYDLSAETTALRAHGTTNHTPIQLNLGRKKQAWSGNCVAIGHAAAVVEPLTPAPMMLLQRDIERLLELIPITADMHVEQRQYNQRFKDDCGHAMLFQRSLFETKTPLDTAYFKAARAQPICDRLLTKLTQFESRGTFVQYDNELFNQEDWAILHYGMQRIPKRYDPLADRVPEAHIEQTLLHMRTAINQMVKRMPAHETYMSKFLAYLKENHAN